ncbi:MAG: MATE family efflux transporter [Alphaproteobacteria bacterium]|jgi:putative MATE family efflux protein|nr:MATE family efflux transporter [Alphaproteobacteria bacterium]
MEVGNTSPIQEEGFYKRFFVIVIPLILQQFVSISLNFIDTIMVGKLGETSIAAVGVANKLYFIYALMLFGALGGASIFLAQYYGKKDYRNFRRVFFISIIVAIAFGAIFTPFAIIFAEPFMELFSNDLEVIFIGTGFLQLVAVSFPFNAISIAIAFALRSMGKTKQALYIVLVATIINTVLNYGLIYGNWGLPRMEARGAALATLIARLVEFSICLYFFFNAKYQMRATNWKKYLGFPKDKIESLVKISIPVFFTETVWVLATTVLYVAYGSLGTSALASVNIAELVINAGSIIVFGVATGANIIIAQTIGSGRLELAFAMSKKIIKMAIGISLSLSILALLFRGQILNEFPLSPEAAALTDKVLIAFSIAMFFKFINWIALVGVLRAGGDTKVAFFIDALPVVFIAIPLAFYTAMVLELEIYWVVLIANIEEVVKCVIALWRFIGKKWMKNLT